MNKIEELAGMTKKELTTAIELLHKMDEEDLGMTMDEIKEAMELKHQYDEEERGFFRL